MLHIIDNSQILPTNCKQTKCTMSNCLKLAHKYYAAIEKCNQTERKQRSADRQRYYSLTASRRDVALNQLAALAHNIRPGKIAIYKKVRRNREKVKRKITSATPYGLIFAV